MKIKRRDFLRGAAAASGGAIIGGSRRARGDDAGAKDEARLLPAPATSGIEHIVVVMMENRSFDHVMGWLPNADGRQEGLTYLDSGGTAHETFPLAPDYTGCDHPDPDHSYAGGRTQFNG